MSSLALIKNHRGNAMISSIMLASLVGAAAFTAYKSFSVTYSSTRASRIKAKQAVMEAQVRRRAIQPEAYQDCDSGVTNRCHVRPEFFTDLNDQYVQGAQCGAQGIGNCGLSVKNLNFDPASRQFSAYVGYDGGEVNIKPVAVQLTVPTEVLQSPVFNCGLLDPLKPIFTGFDTNNQPKCEGFTACDKGSFVAGVDLGLRKLTCKPLPASVSCPQQNMFTRLAWAGGSVQYSCGELPDPPFTSRLNTRSVAGVDPGGTPTNTDPTENPGVATATVTVTDTYTATSVSTATQTATDPNSDQGRWKFNSPGADSSVCWAGVVTHANCSSGMQTGGAPPLPVNQESGPDDCPQITNIVDWFLKAAAPDGGPCKQKGSNCRYHTPGFPPTPWGTCIMTTNAGSDVCGYTCR